MRLATASLVFNLHSLLAIYRDLSITKFAINRMGYITNLWYHQNISCEEGENGCVLFLGASGLPGYDKDQIAGSAGSAH